MLTSRWFPLMTSELNRFQREVDRMLTAGGAGRWPGLAYTYPPVNVWEDEQNYYAEAELPGMPLDGLEIFVREGNQVTIQGERKPNEAAAAPGISAGARFRQVQPWLHAAGRSRCGKG